MKRRQTYFTTITFSISVQDFVCIGICSFFAFLIFWIWKSFRMSYLWLAHQTPPALYFTVVFNCVKSTTVFAYLTCWCYVLKIPTRILKCNYSSFSHNLGICRTIFMGTLFFVKANIHYSLDLKRETPKKTRLCSNLKSCIWFGIIMATSDKKLLPFFKIWKFQIWKIWKLLFILNQTRAQFFCDSL